MIDIKRLVKLTQDLIRIDSRNPGGSERDIALFVKRYLEALGIKANLYEFKEGRTNVVARLRGRGSRRSLLVTPHLDTVPQGKGWKMPPFTGRVSGGKIYGLGATDCKCNLAVSLEVIRSLVEDRAVLGYDLIFAATADEEAGSALGIIPLLDNRILKPDAALVLDVDDFKVIVAQKGLIHLKVKLKGKSSHAAYPKRGINAIEAAVKILGELGSEKRPFKKNKYLGPPTFNIGTIVGGDKVNMVAGWCDFELDFRFLPGQDPEDIIKALRHIIKKHAYVYDIEIKSIQKDYLLDAKHPIVRTLKRSLKKSGITPKVTGSEAATTITFFQHKNIPAVACGFGVDGCEHSADEYVTIANLSKGAKVLESFLKDYEFS